MNKSWNNGRKRDNPRRRGRTGSQHTYGTNLSKSTMDAIERQAEKRVRRQARREIAQALKDRS